MKRYSFRILIVFAAVVILLFNSCSSDKTGDIKELLKTIPSDASLVAVVDMEKTLREVGFKVKDGDVSPGKDLAEKLKSQKDENIKLITGMVINGGVAPSCCALFAEGYNLYATGFISNTDQFKKTVAEKFGESFVTEGDVSTCGNVACTSDRFWVCISSQSSILPKDIKFFQNLSEKQSILSGEASQYLLKSESSVRGWGDIKGCLNALGLDFTTKAAAQMGLEALFADAVEFQLDLDINKDELEMDVTLLNSKGGVAAFLYPTSEIDVKSIRDSGLKGAAFAAIAISPKFISKMQEDTKGKGISVLGMLSGMISEVNGTVMLAMGEDSKLSGVIPVKGNNTGELTSLLSQYDMTVTRENGNLCFNNGATDGSLVVADVAEIFKGSMAGVVMVPEKWTGKRDGYVSLQLKPEKGGMKIIIKGKNIY